MLRIMSASKHDMVLMRYNSNAMLSPRQRSHK